MNHVEHDNHGHERHSVNRKAGRRSDSREDNAAYEPADDARKIELDRHQRDRVLQIFLVHERRDKRLVGRPAESLSEAVHQRGGHDMPDFDHVQPQQDGQNHRGQHLDILRDRQDLAAVHAVRGNAAK